MIGWCSRCGYEVETDDAGQMWNLLWSHLCTTPRRRPRWLELVR